MKWKHSLFITLLFLPLVAALASMGFLPMTLPVHFDAFGNVTRWAGKSVVLVFPACSAAVGLFLGLLAKHAKTPQTRKIWFWDAVIVMLVFMILTVWYLCKAVAVI